MKGDVCKGNSLTSWLKRENEELILVKICKDTWFIVVQSVLIYVHYEEFLTTLLLLQWQWLQRTIIKSCNAWELILFNLCGNTCLVVFIVIEICVEWPRWCIWSRIPLSCWLRHLADAHQLVRQLYYVAQMMPTSGPYFEHVLVRDMQHGIGEWLCRDTLLGWQQRTWSSYYIVVLSPYKQCRIRQSILEEMLMQPRK